MQITEDGIERVRDYYRFKSDPWICPTGHPTIGFNHKIDGTERWRHGISPQYAMPILRKDLEVTEGIQDFIATSISQNMFDALVAFAFDVGEGNFIRSALLRKLNQGDYAGAAAEFDRWVYGTAHDTKGKPYKRKIDGLIVRRRMERRLFSIGLGI